MRAAHVSPSQKHPLAEAEAKGQAQRKKGNHSRAGILQPKRKPSAKCVQWRREEARWWHGGGRRIEGQSRQPDTKRPCVNAVALSLKITNAKIICNLSGPLLHTRSAPLATPTLSAVCDSDTFRFDVRAFRGFSCMKGVWPSSTAAQRASLPDWTVGGGVHCSFSFASQSLDISSILLFPAFFHLPLLCFCVMLVHCPG